MTVPCRAITGPEFTGEDPEPDRVVGLELGQGLDRRPLREIELGVTRVPCDFPHGPRHVEDQEHVGALAKVCPRTLDRVEHDRGRGGQRHRGLVGEQPVAGVDRVPGPARVIAEPGLLEAFLLLGFSTNRRKSSAIARRTGLTQGASRIA